MARISQKKFAFEAAGSDNFAAYTVGQYVKKPIKAIVIVTLIGLIVFGGWTAYRMAAKLYGTNNPFSLIGSFVPSALSETNGRTNILLAGYSADDTGHNGANLTDSIMILSVDNKTKKIDMISVPRDLYVNVPDTGYSKINAVYQIGDADNFNEASYTKGGMGLLEKTVEQVTGVHSNYYALLNYTAFKDTVNAVGGVSVDIKSTNENGLYDPYANLKLANGVTQLDGQEALNLARARGDGPGSYGFAQGDFDRTMHQQELLQALKAKTGSASVIANPLRIGKLAESVGNNVKTDLSIGQVETLYMRTKGISSTNTMSHTLNSYNGKNLLTTYNASGQSALVPRQGMGDYSEIKSTIANTLSSRQ